MRYGFDEHAQQCAYDDEQRALARAASLPLPDLQPIDTTELEANVAWLEWYSAYHAIRMTPATKEQDS